MSKTRNSRKAEFIEKLNMKLDHVYTLINGMN